MPSPYRPTSLAGLLLAATLLAACGGDADSPGNEAVAAETQTETSAERHEHELAPIPEPTGERQFGARLSEYQIDLTTHTIPSGKSTFHILNAGHTAHLFIVRSDDVYFATQHIAPGDSTTLEVDLPPGDYHIVCTVRDEFDHISEGEREELTVE